MKKIKFIDGALRAAPSTLVIAVACPERRASGRCHTYLPRLRCSYIQLDSNQHIWDVPRRAFCKQSLFAPANKRPAKNFAGLFLPRARRDGTD